MFFLTNEQGLAVCGSGSMGSTGSSGTMSSSGSTGSTGREGSMSSSGSTGSTGSIGRDIKKDSAVVLIYR